MQVENFSSQLQFCQQLPTAQQLKASCRGEVEHLVLIYDQNLQVHLGSPWLQQFDLQLPVEAGESLKTLSSFSQMMEQLLQQLDALSSSRLAFVALGGGSIGDFVGFLASVFKRGRALIHIPSTWLAAVDSAHGGKTALNAAGAKNQLGSFWPADSVWLCQQLWQSLPVLEKKQGLAELIKMAMIDQELWQALQPHQDLMAGFDQLLPTAIKGKMKIVNQDPREQTGLRQVLNLGHTLGHVVEAHYNLSHGLAVAQGLYFALNWSLQRQLIANEDHQECTSLLYSVFEDYKTDQSFASIAPEQFYRLAAKDKKSSGQQQLQFVFINKPGQVHTEKVSLEQFKAEACRQGWVQ